MQLLQMSIHLMQRKHRSYAIIVSTNKRNDDALTHSNDEALTEVGCALIFCLEWVVLTLAFFLKYYAYVEGGDLSKRSAKVQQVDEKYMKN
ncbi:hypothetical protein RHMOL_Rhmol04G0254600 [Rhododendron molle]|uniref:Uncharacterized protein n=1 Tax=Rhododendron molle TaxID=49168 RepID=A0ACC0P4N5_RHOML|nr:hypothetical protein RHMOL_Rhmol04G0254600 [Rhododendron molle]